MVYVDESWVETRDLCMHTQYTISGRVMVHSRSDLHRHILHNADYTIDYVSDQTAGNRVGHHIDAQYE